MSETAGGKAAVPFVHAETMDWLLEASDPGPRYLALRDVVGLPSDDPDLVAARRAAHRSGPIAEILQAMHADGFWIAPGPGYSPKYRSTVWSVLSLAQLGARVEEDGRIAAAGAHVLDHALTPYGQFSASGTPGSTADCLQGNLCRALLELGCEDPRLGAALDWMARATTGEGVAARGDTTTPIRYYAGKCGPGFRCGSNDGLPCAWGATKVMLAFGRLPSSARSPEVEAAVDVGVEFLVGRDPTTAPYPSGYSSKPTGNWWKFGFPVFYVTDLLQIAEAMVALGRGDEPRLTPLRDLIRAKADERGRWPLEYGYGGKTWFDAGTKKAPNKWVTIRALRVLGHQGG